MEYILLILQIGSQTNILRIDNQLYLCPPLFQRRFYQDFPEYKSLASRLSLEDTVAFHMI